MSLQRVEAGAKLPEEFNVIIEIASNSNPVKYEVCKHSGVLSVDRLLGCAMHYPFNYGYIPHTYCDDGDPVDVMVMTPFPLVPGCAIAVRPLGMLEMEDEQGRDYKVFAVPTLKIFPGYAHLNDIQDVEEGYLKQIEHFFTHYKDLEKNKWVKTNGWKHIDITKTEIQKAFEAQQARLALEEESTLG